MHINAVKLVSLGRRVMTLVAFIGLLHGGFVLELGSTTVAAEEGNCCARSADCSSGEFCDFHSQCSDVGRPNQCVTIAP
jgi:hypothetical protein